MNRGSRRISQYRGAPRSPRSEFVRVARAAEFQLKAAGNLQVDHPIIVRATQMWKAIERESNGRIAIQWFPGAVLGTDTSTLAQMRVGAVHFIVIAPSSLQAIVSAIDITNVAFAFKDAAMALHVLDGPLGDYVRREVAAKGIYMCRGSWDSGMREMTSIAHPILGPDDLHGFKIRINPSKIMIDLFRDLGASPAPVNFSEMYTALQTKLVDGTDLPLATISSARVFEVQRYVSMTNHTWSGLFTIVGGDLWKRLPSDLQDVIERNNIKYARLEARDNAVMNASLTDKLGRQGLNFTRTIEQAPFRTRLSAYYRTWSAELGSTEWGLLETAIGSKLA